MDTPSFAHILRARFAATPDQHAFQFRADEGAGPFTWMSWGEVHTRVDRIAAGLIDLGVASGDRCGILANTRLEWILTDFGILCAGAATTTVYPSNTDEECAYILSDAGVVVCVVEDVGQLNKLRSQKAALPDLRAAIILNPRGYVADAADPPDGVLTLPALEQRGADRLDQQPDAVDARIKALGPEDLATLIYTSGTTGRPKGVMLVHDCWVGQAESVYEALKPHMRPDDKQFLFLPLAHSFGKVLEIMAVKVGLPTAIDGSIDRLVDNLKETQPTIMGAVPRIFEKVYNKIVNGAQAVGGFKEKMFSWAMDTGLKADEHHFNNRRVPLGLSLQRGLADRLVHQKIRAAFGGRVRAFVSGGAPLAPDIARFFHAAGVLILEGYGLTESSAASVANDLVRYKLGTVGQPYPGTQVKIAADGEVLLKGRGIMRGYFNLPEATAEALENGWLHTGDIGELDADGFLKITGRKKELIITAGGKNIAPAPIENQLKAACPYVSQVVMHGDRRNFCVALVTLNEEAIDQWAEQQGLAERGLAKLSQKAEVKALIQGYLDTVNGHLASYETIKTFALLSRDLTQEDGELTPTLKVKRRVVEAHFAEVLDGFYADSLAKMDG